LPSPVNQGNLSAGYKVRPATQNLVKPASVKIAKAAVAKAGTELTVRDVDGLLARITPQYEAMVNAGKEPKELGALYRSLWDVKNIMENEDPAAVVQVPSVKIAFIRRAEGILGKLGVDADAVKMEESLAAVGPEMRLMSKAKTPVTLVILGGLAIASTLHANAETVSGSCEDIEAFAGRNDFGCMKEVREKKKEFAVAKYLKAYYATNNAEMKKDIKEALYEQLDRKAGSYACKNGGVTASCAGNGESGIYVVGDEKNYLTEGTEGNTEVLVAGYLANDRRVGFMAENNNGKVETVPDAKRAGEDKLRGVVEELIKGAGEGRGAEKGVSDNAQKMVTGLGK